jgi:16S rRNA (cytosine967-C5)-methyltransferase
MTKSARGAAPRVVAAQALNTVLNQGRNLDSALADAGLEAMSGRDRPLARALAYGAARTHLRNACVIEQLVDRPFRRRDNVIVALISVGLFALTESRRPDYAVVSATVDAAVGLGRPQMKGVVNALLRRFLRERDALIARANANEEAQWLHPAWLIDYVRRDWPDDWQQILDANNRQAPMWLRINLDRTTRQRWLARLENAAGSVPEQFPAAVMLREPLAVDELPGFRDGDCSVQDIASQAAAVLLQPQAGMRILDACAAPGGKATHLLEYCPAIKELVALDESPARLARVAENVDRLSLKATLLQGDARKPESWWDGELFDRILLDAPCSATGVIRRHPDIRYLRRPADIAQLVELQHEILQALWQLLKPGGMLLYSTCSMLRAENDQVVARFIDACTDAKIILPALKVPGAAVETSCGMQMLPGRADNDGFYYALMERTFSP